MKTVTFDESSWKLVPVEPTAEMYDAGDMQLATKQVWDAMLAAAPVAPNGWIKCSDRMPDQSGLYACWGTYGHEAEPGYIPAHLVIHPRNDWTIWEPVEDDCDPKKVTISHWMPLPAAPEQEV